MTIEDWMDAMASPKRVVAPVISSAGVVTRVDALDWAGYLTAEQKTFDAVKTHVTDAIEEKDRVQFNRYFEGSVVYPPRFAHDWNRSYVLEPDGAPRGAVVLLHGLTVPRTACATSRAATPRAGTSQWRSACRRTARSRPR